jgi:hypothetical protein
VTVSIDHNLPCGAPSNPLGLIGVPGTEPIDVMLPGIKVRHPLETVAEILRPSERCAVAIKPADRLMHQRRSRVAQ